MDGFGCGMEKGERGRFEGQRGKEHEEFWSLKGKERETGDGWVAGVKERSKYGLIDGRIKEKLNMLTQNGSHLQNIPPYKRAGNLPKYKLNRN